MLELTDRGIGYQHRHVHGRHGLLTTGARLRAGERTGTGLGTLIDLEYVVRYTVYARYVIIMNTVGPSRLFQEETTRRQRECAMPEDSMEMKEIRASEGFASRDAATLSQGYRVAFRQVLKSRELIVHIELDLAGPTAASGQDVAGLARRILGVVDWWDFLDEMGVPALVLHGQYDGPPVDMSRQLSEALTLGTFEVLNNGHFPFVEDRHVLLSEFFAGLSR